MADELSALDSQRVRLCSDLEMNAMLVESTREALEAAVYRKAQLVAAALAEEGPAAPTLNLAHFTEVRRMWRGQSRT